MRQIPLAIGPVPLHTFEGFVPGTNAAALTHLQALAATLRQPTSSPAAPTYLWGACGSGKTHLLRALTAQAGAQGHSNAWFDASSALPWHFDDAWALVLIDACEALDASQQHAAFSLFIEAGAQGVPIVAAGALPPVDLPLREDLRTRLAWGHVFALEPLSEGDARAAVRREADRRGIFLSDEVMAYLLSRFSRDMQHLIALLDRLDEFALSQGRAVSVPLLKRMFEQEGAEL